ncbi:hypothetical protein LB503_005338 [Fusarium chuoi]|nr:hypothetical protein LB503_005338 [Fusarium chuoi]
MLSANSTKTNKAYKHIPGPFHQMLIVSQFRAKYKQLWDDSMFTADRDGNDNTTGISFHVESSDHNVIQGVTPPSESHAYGAPSRPPSRSNNRSPLGTMVDWTAAHVPGVPESQAQEDDDMQRAIRESAQEAGLPVSHHESGIIGTSEPSPPHFGPANRETYVAADWAIVPSDPMKESSVVNTASAGSSQFCMKFLLHGTYSSALDRLLPHTAVIMTGGEDKSFYHRRFWQKWLKKAVQTLVCTRVAVHSRTKYTD